MPQAAARQPIGGEDPMLELHERVEVAALGFANADVRLRRMGKVGRHRHQRQALKLPASRWPCTLPFTSGAAARTRAKKVPRESGKKGLNPIAACRDTQVRGR
jgi:hypothetical protein